jgi:subtilisin family serine protease
LAEGIVRAVDAGAKIINISMGSFGDSGIMRDAVAYANERGVLMVAAVGNNGIERVTYPAAYDSVIAVGAVDATGMHMEFSNFGSAVDLVAPGYGVNAAWSGDEAVRVSGTSFSAPIVTGAVAALMSEKSLSARQAYELLMANLNDGGAAGSDAQYGGGMPDVGRALSRDQPGIYDAAIASHRVLAADPSNPNGQVEVVVQNRGTEPVVNTSVKVSVGGVVSTSNLTMLAPNAVATVRVPVRENWRESGEGLRIESSASLSGGMIDSKPSNDRRIEIHGAVDAN